MAKLIDDEAIVAAVREAIGAEPGDEVIITGPQFERSPGEPVQPKAPLGEAGFDALVSMSPDALYALGMRRWGRREDAAGVEYGPMLWLYPGEWYEAIPSGYSIVDISFRNEKFVLGVTDNDIRFGCLAFGVMVPHEDDAAGTA